MQGTIMAQGVELMLYGMGSVVMFLALLVVATTAMSAAIGRFFAETQPQPLSRPAPPAGPVPADADAETVAVISAAIHRYRSRN